MGRPAKKMIGLRFGKLRVVARNGSNSIGHPTFACVCDCGVICQKIRGSDLRSGQRSCGCERLKGGFDGIKSHPLYETWRAMIRRCIDKGATGFKNYGGRGIKVCKRWMTAKNFIADVGPKPSPLHTLDRIDNDKNYEPSNVRWATAKEQIQNQRNTKKISHEGKTMCLSDWAKELGLPKSTLLNRFARGWSAEKALVAKRG